MEPDQGLQHQIRECLTGMGISSPVDWDVLVFVYRHRTSLADSDQIARMLGYPSDEVGNSLEHLESLNLLRRSGAPGGVNLYQCVASVSERPPHNYFRQLIPLIEDRAARLQITKKPRQTRKKVHND